MSDVIATDLTNIDWQDLVNQLNRYLRLRTTAIGMKLFKTVEEMEAVPRIRRPKNIHTTDQIVGQASRNGWTVGITAEDLVGDQCRTVVGLAPRSEDWLAGKNMAGVWYENDVEATKHQQAMDLAPFGAHVALAVSPLASGWLNPPDIALIYATPAQMILFINGLQWTGYKKLEWGCVGESACADSWGRALATGEPSLSIPCFAERRYGGVMEDELLMAIPPAFLPKIIEGLDRLSRNGLRYPIPQYGINNDVRAGMSVSYG
ncbi:MAG: hypothetical protein F4029_01405 [Gammaproteobacteria bacterium]|nr:hypothetical protein [Gammaproteobacteria bacterium]MYK44865.1 hypothetical protein [Gammaproteobacteria bacterium]